jgi:ATP-binding cassette subfamily B (MDR/TAP) protein 1
VLAKGRKIETGSHSELINLEGAYARLVKAQDLGKRSEQIEDTSDDGEDEVNVEKELTHVSIAGAESSSPERAVDKYGLLYGLFLIIKEQRTLWWPAFVTFISCMVGGETAQFLLNYESAK